MSDDKQVFIYVEEREEPDLRRLARALIELAIADDDKPESQGEEAA